jgi:hypothetical protein
MTTMSRPLKIIPPLKGTFNEILTRIADGHGVKKPPQNKAVKSPPQKPKKP